MNKTLAHGDADRTTAGAIAPVTLPTESPPVTVAHLDSVAKKKPSKSEKEKSEQSLPFSAHDAPHEQDKDIYDRFSKKRKRVVVFIVAFAALLAPFASSAFLPSIPQIANDLHTSEAVINYSVAVYLVVIGVAPLAWSRYATFYGRQPIYLVSMPIFVLGSIGVAESRSLAALIVTRIIQGIGASSVLSIGAGSIADIYRPTERGRAMGLYLAGSQFGPPLAPVIGGIVTQYAHGSRGTWRAFQYLLAAMGAFTFTLVLSFLPETSHSRGFERMRSEGHTRRWVWLNPLRPLRMLKLKNVLLISLNSSFILLTTYCILVPLPYTLGPRYGITNAAVLGSLYLAQGGGNIIGSHISGYISDRMVHRWIARRSGQFIPEDRLRASFWAGGAATPLSLLAAGLTMQFWTSKAGLAVSLLFLLINGAALLGVLAISNTYLVDSYQTRSAEVIAANNCIRYLFAAGASAAVLPLMKTIGIAPANAIAAAIAWIGFLLVFVVMRYGRGWREELEGAEAVKSEEVKESRADVPRAVKRESDVASQAPR